MTTQTGTPEPPPSANAWQEQYGATRATLSSDGTPKIKVLCKKTLTFVEGAGTAGRHTQIEAKPGIQEVDAWIQKTATFEMGTKDSSIIVVVGASAHGPEVGPPTIDQVMTVRKCSQQDAEKIVALEQVKFDQGEYPYPPKNAPAPEPVAAARPDRPSPPTLEEVMASGYSEEAAKGIVAREKEKADSGIWPYGTKTDPAGWGPPPLNSGGPAGAAGAAAPAPLTPESAPGAPDQTAAADTAKDTSGQAGDDAVNPKNGKKTKAQ